ncbi:MAG TPA: ABC transporter substrate-binding protein [Acidimicrobiales bacterium]|nr:ABC transporter substrate-binding protein [Acidimicrobiales bacterium]
MRKRNAILASLAAVGMVAGIGATATTSVAAGATKSPAAVRAASGSGSTLTISNAEFLWTCGFSPFNPSSNFLSLGPVYEPLDFVNTLQNAKVTPWLARSYAWSNGNRTLTFTIRSGVKWSDGTPLTAADVAFTFNMLKKNPALDLNSIWSVLSSVAQKGSDQVVMTFKTPAVPYFYYIADQVGIVPQHIWSKVANPVTYKDANPVGTGAYTVQSCTPQNVSYVKNTKYWQPGLPKIAKIEYPAFTSNPPANTLLSTGQAQWGGQFIPNLQAEYLSKSSNNHYWFPPVVNVSMFINQTVPLLNNVAVRKAMAFAVDRSRVAKIGEYGYENAGNQAGVVTPTFSSWLDSSALKSSGYSYDPAKAISILKKAGFTKGPGGVFQNKQGKQLSFTIINQSAYTDWVAALQVVSQELSAVGIKLTVDNLAGTDYSAKLYDGNFQLAYGYEAGGPSPYYEFRQWLYGPSSAPVGKPAATNWERYSNPATDALINSYASSSSSSEQHAIVNKLQQILLNDVPLIPVTEQADWDEYSTAQFTGWPTPSNPYAQPFPYVSPDWGIVLLHLRQK